VVAKMNVESPLSVRNVEDLLDERGIGICHETNAIFASAQPLMA
jgi:transposase-like protein